MIKNKCRRWLRRAAGMLACLLVFLPAAAATAHASESRVLRVAFPELHGISETDQYGNHTGLLVDYLNEIAKYTDWKYEYIVSDNDDVVSNFQDGQYDLMGGNFYYPGFEEFFAYPDYSTGRSRAVLLCRRDDNRLLGYDLTSLNGKTIGVYEKAEGKIRHLKEFLASNDLDCELRYFTFKEMDPDGTLYRYLRDGEVDMLLGNELETDGEFRMVTSFQAQPYYIVTTVGNTEILEGLNMALRYILESTPDFAEDTYNANFPDVKYTDIQFNDKELNYIGETDMLTVAVPANWHPVYCRDTSSGQHKGLLPDLLEEIEQFSGLNFTYVNTETYEESIQLVQRGEADILGIYLGQEEQAFSDGLALSQSYIGLSNMVLKHKSVSYPGDGLVCGIITGCILPCDFKAEKVRSYDTVTELITAVNKGEVDFIYGVSATLEQEMQNHRYVNVVPVTQVVDNADTAFAIARPAKPELLTILNKAIANIPTEEKAAMLNRNLVSVGYTNLSFQELVYANPIAFILILGFVLLLVMTVVLLVIRNRMKNAIMQSQLKAAEAKSLAKSDFLSKMSHEIRTPMNAIVGLTDLTCMEQDMPPEIENKLKKIRSSSQYLLSLINDILDMSRIENGKMEIEQKEFSLSLMLEELIEMMRPQAEQKGLQFQALCQIGHKWLVGDSLRLRQILTNLISNAIKFTSAGGTVTLRIDETACDGQTVEYRFSVQDTGTGIPLEAQERVFTAFEQLSPSTSQSVGTGLGLPISRSMARLMGGDLFVESKPGKGSDFYMTLRFLLGEGEARLQPECPGQEKSLEGIRILLAEDNDLNAEIAQELLSIQGMKVQRAVDGREAVELFMSSAPGEFHAILMDIQMPVKDGNEAAREIRASGRSDAGVPIIAMTANSFKEDEAAARAAGMNSFVPKPVDINQLFSVLRKVL